MGVFHVYPVYQRIVPLFRSRSDFYVFQFQHVDNGAPHQQKQQRDQRRGQQRTADGTSRLPAPLILGGELSGFRVFNEIVADIL